MSFHADGGLSTTSATPPLGVVVALRSLKDDDDSAFAISVGADRDERANKVGDVESVKSWGKGC